MQSYHVTKSTCETKLIKKEHGVHKDVASGAVRKVHDVGIRMSECILVVPINTFICNKEKPQEVTC